jgi:hypothetical protein
MIFHFIPQQFIKRKNDQECVIEFTWGSIFQLKGGDDPDRLRGPGPLGCVFDEFGTMKLEAWQVVEPAIIANNGWTWFIGTPKGKNHLFQFLERSKTMKGWGSFYLNGENSGIYNKDQLLQLRSSMTQKMYAQEIMCDFLENEGTVFRGVRDAMQSEVESPKKEHLYVIGCDLAKVTDYTVLTVYDRIHNNQVYQERFQTIEWPFQKAKIAALSKHYNNALVILDATGLGDPIADDLTRQGVPVTPFKITEQTKKQLIEKLSLWIEQKICLLLPLNETLEEFDNFSYEIGPTGKIRYQAREGFHDDIVISHSLAIYGLQPIVKEIAMPDDSRLHKHFVRIKDEYIRGLITDQHEFEAD